MDEAPYPFVSVLACRTSAWLNWIVNYLVLGYVFSDPKTIRDAKHAALYQLNQQILADFGVFSLYFCGR